MRAESIVKVNEDFAKIIQEAGLIDNSMMFKAGESEITVLNVHNSLVEYILKVLPIKDPQCLQLDGN